MLILLLLLLICPPEKIVLFTFIFIKISKPFYLLIDALFISLGLSRVHYYFSITGSLFLFFYFISFILAILHIFVILSFYFNLGPSRPSRSEKCCDDPGNCSYHNPVVSPICLRRVRGVPPSVYIPRPYFNGVIRSSASSSTTPAEAHDALFFLLGTVRKVFDASEVSLNELDAWHRYFDMGN